MSRKKKKTISWIFFCNHHDNGAMDRRLTCVTFESNQCKEEHNVQVHKNSLHLIILLILYLKKLAT